jgi:hypothetical protein
LQKLPHQPYRKLSGTLQQTSPEVGSFNRKLELRWQGNAPLALISDIMTNENSYVNESLMNCQLFPAEDDFFV